MSPPQLVTLRKRRRMLAVRSSPSTWMLPILDRDRLASKLDAAADRTHGVLRVKAIHQHCRSAGPPLLPFTSRSGRWPAGWA